MAGGQTVSMSENAREKQRILALKEARRRSERHFKERGELLRGRYEQRQMEITVPQKFELRGHRSTGARPAVSTREPGTPQVTVRFASTIRLHRPAVDGADTSVESLIPEFVR